MNSSPAGTAQTRHTHVSLRIHVIFSTRGRAQLIPNSLQKRLWTYIAGITKNLGFRCYAVGGTENHVHVLLALPATIPLAKAMQQIKANSSRWMNEQNAAGRFAWQEGYGAFSIGVSQMAATTRYIENQEEHHHGRTFERELQEILRRHNDD